MGCEPVDRRSQLFKLIFAGNHLSWFVLGVITVRDFSSFHLYLIFLPQLSDHAKLWVGSSVYNYFLLIFDLILIV